MAITFTLFGLFCAFNFECCNFFSFPNFLSVEPRPFDIEHYEDEAEEEDELDEEGRTRLKLKVENTIRWRKVMDKTTGKETVQSNARIVKWSDGTQSLIVGNEKFGTFCLILDLFIT